MQSNARHATGRFVMGQLLCAVALAGTALAGPSTQSAEAATAHHPALGKTTYRVVNLAPGEFLNAVINARGEVAYSLADPWPGPGPGIGPTSSWFYDGARSINIGRQGVSGFLSIADLNNAGQVLGFGERSPGRSGVSIWTKRHGYTELGLLPTTDRILEAHINNHGVVAGSAAGPDNVNLAFRWSRANGMEDLGALGNGEYRIAYARGSTTPAPSRANPGPWNPTTTASCGHAPPAWSTSTPTTATIPRRSASAPGAMWPAMITTTVPTGAAMSGRRGTACAT